MLIIDWEREREREYLHMWASLWQLLLTSSILLSIISFFSNLDILFPINLTVILMENTEKDSCVL